MGIEKSFNKNKTENATQEFMTCCVNKTVVNTSNVHLMPSFFMERLRLKLKLETNWNKREREISIGKNKEYKKEKIFYMDVLKNKPQKDKQSKNEVKRKR